MDELAIASTEQRTDGGFDPRRFAGEVRVFHRLRAEALGFGVHPDRASRQLVLVRHLSQRIALANTCSVRPIVLAGFTDKTLAEAADVSRAK